MERNVYDILEERGFLKQCSHPEELRELLGREKVTFYIGFDPTADSLHIGHYVALMTMAHMQRAGHRPIALLGGGTAMIADPSGKTELRKMLTVEELDYNASCFQKQMERLVEFGEDKAIMVNNADWLRNLNYMDFMRDIAVHFNVNRMLSAECYKQRMASESGLTFFELGYMLLQSYDFLMLQRRYGCVLEMGGDDQWSNMLGGVQLIRKKEQKPSFCLTTQLLTNSEGKKMGKTEKGALWLDEKKCSVFDFYQYWRNVDDGDVERCLALLTFLPMEEVKRLGSLKDSAINEAKRVLAFTLTEQVHGTEKAKAAQQAAEGLFLGKGDLSNMPTRKLTEAEILESGMLVPKLLVLSGLCKSTSDARRMIESGAVFVDEEKVTSFGVTVPAEKLDGDGVILKKGKKGFCRICRG